MNRHFVHIYATVRVKYAVDGCETQSDAINVARSHFLTEGEEILNRYVREEEHLGPPERERGVQLIYTEGGDEITGFLVDEAGDDEFERSRDYDGDGKEIEARTVNYARPLEGDDGCPKSDPECLGNNGDCHDACEQPTA